MTAIHSDVVNLLSCLGVSSLTGYVGKEKVLRFNSLGLPISSEFLAEILFIEQGVKIFKNQSLRLELLASLGRDALSEVLGKSGSMYDDLKDYNNFSWGDNRKSKDFLGLFGIGGNAVSEKENKSPSEFLVDVPFCLHSYQNWVRKKIVDFLNDASKLRTLVHMPTGAGKTRTSMEAVCDFLRGPGTENKSVVWLAHSEELCEQAVESFELSWRKLGTHPVKAVRMWGGRRVDLGDDSSDFFLVISFQTAYGLITSGDDVRFKQATLIRQRAGLLIVDEAHQSTAPTYKEVIDVFSGRGTKIIGLTATPGRHHVGADHDPTVELSEFYQNNKINIVGDQGEELENPIGFLTNKGVLAALNKYKLDSGVDIEISASEKAQMEKLLDVPSSVLKKLGRNEQRTNLIAAQAIKLALENQFPTIIFAPSKDNAVELATLLTLKNCRSAAITADSTSQERQDIISEFKSGDLPVLVNFGVLTTGFDAPNIKAVIIARPTTSVVLYSQMIGRGLRGPLMGGESECALVDVVDNLVNMPSSDQAFTYFDSFYN